MNAVPRRSVAVIDYLRGLAAFGVALYHVRVTLWVGWRAIQANPGMYSMADRMVAWLSIPTPYLGSLVMLFFVISGFCVHLPQAGADGPLMFKPYFTRRFLRIYPPYLAAALVSILVSLWLAQPAASARAILSSVLMVQNYTGGRSASGLAESIQLPTDPALWSLPVEMELYLVYPLMFAMLRRFGPGRMLAVTGLVSAAATTGYFSGLYWLTGNFAKYWIIWCAGAWLAEKWSRNELRPPPAWCGVAALICLVAGLIRDSNKMDPALGHLAYGMFYFWAVWVLLAYPGLWNRLPGFVGKALAWLGRVSYSFYLLHFPLFFVLGALWVAAFGSKPANFLWPLAACVAILPLIGLFYRWIEKPSHEWAKRLGKAGTGSL